MTRRRHRPSERSSLEGLEVWVEHRAGRRRGWLEASDMTGRKEVVRQALDTADRRPEDDGQFCYQ